MKLHKEIQTIKKALYAVICDICGQKSHVKIWYDNENKSYIKILIKREETNDNATSDDNGNYVYYVTGEIDMCPTCWSEKFEPWLLSEKVRYKNLFGEKKV